jgi:hypothetical protein
MVTRNGSQFQHSNIFFLRDLDSTERGGETANFSPPDALPPYGLGVRDMVSDVRTDDPTIWSEWQDPLSQEESLSDSNALRGCNMLRRTGLPENPQDCQHTDECCHLLEVFLYAIWTDSSR